jgi:transcriptional regulator with XRE-family HTH domain
MTTAAPNDLPAGGTTYLRIVEEVSEAGITQVELARAVGASTRTVQNWAAGRTVPTGVKAQRLLDLQYIVRELRTAYTDEGIRIWLNARNRNLGRQRPIDLLTSGEFDRVLAEAERVAGAM